MSWALVRVLVFFLRPAMITAPAAGLAYALAAFWACYV